ncbi:NTAN1 [Symbiodinium sp. KB8]|nr:NTAN1 [Symbiodinium sp. KB8]
MVLYWKESKVDNAREVARAAAEAADAKEFVAAAVKAVPAAQSLCVLQKECGVAQPSHPLLRYVGSVDATTCLLVFVVRPDHVSVGHLDNPETSIQPLLPQGSPATEVKEEEAPERLTVHLVGSFLTGDRSEEETEELSERLVYGVLQQLIDSKREFNLGTAAVLSTNTYMREGIARPRVTDAAWDMKEQTLIPVKFEGECFAAASSDLVPVYNASAAANKLIIAPFTVDPLPLRLLQYLCSMDDEELLQETSTSPKAEPPHFVEHMRDTLQYLILHHKWSGVFKGKPKVWEITPKGWSAAAL